MCTASWLIRSDGYELFFNRDEAVTRAVARPPERQVADGVRHLAPTDEEAGGTWIGVNELGLTIGLLNAWDVGQLPERPRRDPEPFTSRGLLVRELLGCASPKEVRRRLGDAQLARYRGFRVLVLAPGSAPIVFGWDGRELGREPAGVPLVSSSLDVGRAREARVAVLRAVVRRRGKLDRAALEEFQASHEPERGAWSPCMHRADAGTVSATHVTVAPGRVTLRYATGSPCSTPWSPPRVLARGSRPLGVPTR